MSELDLWMALPLFLIFSLIPVDNFTSWCLSFAFQHFVHAIFRVLLHCFYGLCRGEHVN